MENVSHMYNPNKSPFHRRRYTCRALGRDWRLLPGASPETELYRNVGNKIYARQVVNTYLSYANLNRFVLS